MNEKTHQPGVQRPDVLTVANRLRPLLLQLNRGLRRETHALGVTAGQVSLLGSVHGSPGLGVGELAALEGMTAPAVCGHMDKLESAGLVTRTRDADGDRRRVGLHVTPEGERVLLTVRSRRTAWLAERIGRLGSEDLAILSQAVGPLRALVEDVR